jgi:hypothetical protein
MNTFEYGLNMNESKCIPIYVEEAKNTKIFIICGSHID